MKITITLEDIEATGLKIVAADPEEWAGNMVRNRARQALEEIVGAEVQHLISAREPIPPTREEILRGALDSGRVVFAADLPSEPPPGDAPSPSL